MNLAAKLTKVGVSAVVLGWSAMACSSTPEPEQAIVASNVQPNPNSPAGCSSPEKFIYLPESANIPGPDTNDTTNRTVTGGDVNVACSIIPSGNGYTVTLQGQISGGVAPGTLTVTGTFTPRVRDANGKSSTTGDATKIPNIHVSMLDATKHLDESDCYAEYTLVDDGQPGNSLPDPADVFADDNGGRIWVSVFCPSATNELESQKPGNAGCEMSATFRFENCVSKGQ